jgi:hypothetical protein
MSLIPGLSKVYKKLFAHAKPFQTKGALLFCAIRARQPWTLDGQGRTPISRAPYERNKADTRVIHQVMVPF